MIISMTSYLNINLYWLIMYCKIKKATNFIIFIYRNTIIGYKYNWY